MSHLIRSHKVVLNAPRSIPWPPISAATALVEMDHRPVNPVDLVDLVGLKVSQVPASLAFSMAQLVSARIGHRRPHTLDTSTSTTDASGSQ
ncbi:hypothetical protein C1H46_020482 [Malus baccata]|uniref:Uncharacterized protein n=1 Tax=Malus baccata TaxID=106549 RepID=A0A540M599_MALBA|nr:hypothetical protein C1H46_020482 [Malus baccata]